MKIHVASNLQQPATGFATLDTTKSADILRLLSLTNQQTVAVCSDWVTEFQITYESGLVLMSESENT